VVTPRVTDRTRSPSEWDLRDLPARVVTFLYAAGTHAPIRAALQTGGYTITDHHEGLRLLTAVCAFRSTGVDPAENEVPRRAEAELHDWLRTHPPRLQAALQRLHPDQAALLRDVSSSEPSTAPLVVAQLLERLDALPNDVPSTSALTTLARRGFDTHERQRLWRLVHIARQALPPQGAADGALGEARQEPGWSMDGAGGSSASNADGPSQTDNLIALYDWYSDWVATARAFVRRKDWLLRLGLMRRRRG